MITPWDPDFIWSDLASFNGDSRFRQIVTAIRDQLRDKAYYPWYRYVSDVVDNENWVEIRKSSPLANTTRIGSVLWGPQSPYEFGRSCVVAIDGYFESFVSVFLDMELLDWSYMSIEKLESRIGRPRPFIGSPEGNVRLPPSTIDWYYQALNLLLQKTRHTEYWDGLLLSSAPNIFHRRDHNSVWTTTGDTTSFFNRWSFQTGGWHSEPWEVTTSAEGGTGSLEMLTTSQGRTKVIVTMDLKTQGWVPPVGNYGGPDSEWDTTVKWHSFYVAPHKQDISRITSADLYDGSYIPYVQLNLGFLSIYWGGIIFPNPYRWYYDPDIIRFTATTPSSWDYSPTKFTYQHPDIRADFSISGSVAKANYLIGDWTQVHERSPDGSEFIASIYFNETLMLTYTSTYRLFGYYRVFVRIANAARPVFYGPVEVTMGNGELK